MFALKILIFKPNLKAKGRKEERTGGRKRERQR